MRSLLRVFGESAPRGCEKQVELGDCILASRTNQQMLLKTLTLARRHPFKGVSFGGLFDSRRIGSAG